MGSGGSGAGGALSGAASGAAAGSAAGPYGAAIGGAVGLAGSLIGGGKSSGASEEASQKQMNNDIMMSVWQDQQNQAAAQRQWEYNQYGFQHQTDMNRDNAQLSNNMNLSNASWANDLNWQNANQVNANNAGITAANQAQQNYVTGQNRPDQIGVGGGTVQWTKDANGNPVQTSSLGAASQGLYDQAQGVQSNMLGGLEGGFGVDNSVMQAIRGLQNPGIQQAEDAMNARLAAQGLSTGSGTAWNNAQNTLNTTRTNADLQAILGGNTAWQQSQANMRNNLGAAGNTTSQQINDFRNSMPDFYKQQAALQNQQNGFAGVNIPGVNIQNAQLAGYGQTSFPSTANFATNATNAGNLAGRATGNSWSSAAQGLGNLVGSGINAYNSQPTYQQTFGSYDPFSS